MLFGRYLPTFQRIVFLSYSGPSSPRVPHFVNESTTILRNVRKYLAQRPCVTSQKTRIFKRNFDSPDNDPLLSALLFTAHAHWFRHLLLFVWARVRRTRVVDLYENYTFFAFSKRYVDRTVYNISSSHLICKSVR